MVNQDDNTLLPSSNKKLIEKKKHSFLLSTHITVIYWAAV